MMKKITAIFTMLSEWMSYTGKCLTVVSEF